MSAYELLISDWSSDVCSSDLQRELNFNVDLTYPIEVGFTEPLNLAGGLEWRRETWEVTPGELASYQVGPFASVLDPDTPDPTDRIGLPAGSSGFPGLGPSQARSEEHTSELQPLMRISYAVFC